MGVEIDRHIQTERGMKNEQVKVSTNDDRVIRSDPIH